MKNSKEKPGISGKDEDKRDKINSLEENSIANDITIDFSRDDRKIPGMTPDETMVEGYEVSPKEEGLPDQQTIVTENSEFINPYRDPQISLAKSEVTITEGANRTIVENTFTEVLSTNTDDPAPLSTPKPDRRMSQTRPRPGILQIGDLVNDKYRVVEFLGRGGMGEVYKVLHTELDKMFAMKLLLSNNPSALQRFIDEAKTAMGLVHEHAIQVRDVGTTGTGYPYFTMDYSKGLTLQEVIEREKEIPEERALRIIRQVLSALNILHTRKEMIVHRDLKPANVLIENRNNRDHAMVLDFGIAKTVTESEQDNTIMIGTPHYMPPEQILGGKLDHRSDHYAVGVMLFEMITGRRPFNVKSTQALVSSRLIQRPSPREAKRDISIGAENIIKRAMEQNIDDRFPTTQKFIDAIDEFLNAPRNSPLRMQKSGWLKLSLRKMIVFLVFLAILFVGVIVIMPKKYLASADQHLAPSKKYLTSAKNYLDTAKNRMISFVKKHTASTQKQQAKEENSITPVNEEPPKAEVKKLSEMLCSALTECEKASRLGDRAALEKIQKNQIKAKEQLRVLLKKYHGCSSLTEVKQKCEDLAIACEKARAMLNDLPEVALSYQGIRFFEADKDGVPLGERSYRTHFPKSTTRYVHYEVSVKNLWWQKRDTSGVVRVEYYGPGGKLFGKSECKYRTAGAGEKFCLTHGLTCLQSWDKGRYEVDIYIDGVKVDKDEFMLYDDVDTVKFVNLQLFEAGENLPSRVCYRERFAKSETRYIYFALTIKNELYQIKEQTIRLSARYYGSDGVLIREGKGKLHFPTKLEQTTLRSKYGWAQPGKWNAGDYRLEILINDKKIAESSFSVYDDTKAVELKKARLFEGRFTPEERPNRNYGERFKQMKTRSIFYELRLKSHLKGGHGKSVKVTAKYYYGPDNRELASREQQVTMPPAGEEFFVERGWQAPGYWPVGKYRIEIFIDDERIAKLPFEIYRDF